MLDMGGAGHSNLQRASKTGNGNGLTPHVGSLDIASTSALALRIRSSRRRIVSNGSDEERSASVSSYSRSANSREEDSIFDLDSMHSASTSGSLSWLQDAETVTTTVSGYADRRGPDAGDKDVEPFQDGRHQVRTEEECGRPDSHVKELVDAIEDKNLDLVCNENVDEISSGEEQEATKGFENTAPHVVLQATVTGITKSHIIVAPTKSTDEGESRVGRGKLWSIDSLSIPYTHLIYALGSHLPDPLRTAARSKQEGVFWMRHTEERIRGAQRIVLVRGDALGVEFATDVKSVYPEKDVTLIHSWQRLLSNFDEQIHNHAKARLDELGVKLVFGERLALTEGCPRGSTTAHQKRPAMPEWTKTLVLREHTPSEDQRMLCTSVSNASEQPAVMSRCATC